MFAPLQVGSSRKQCLTSALSFVLQLALLLLFVPGGHHGRAHFANARPKVSEIYFQPAPVEAKDTTATAVAPAPQKSHPTPEPPHQSEPAKPEESEVAANTQADGDEDDSAEGQGSWTLNPMPASFVVMDHQVFTAQPVFTPDPPILHGSVPSTTRGKDLVLEVVINEAGTIATAQVLQEVDYEVETSIVETLRQWTFVPAKVNGTAVASRRVLRFHFPG